MKWALDSRAAHARFLIERSRNVASYRWEELVGNDDTENGSVPTTSNASYLLATMVVIFYFFYDRAMLRSDRKYKEQHLCKSKIRIKTEKWLVILLVIHMSTE